MKNIHIIYLTITYMHFEILRQNAKKSKVGMKSHSVPGDLLSTACFHFSNMLSVTVKSVVLVTSDGLLMPSVPMIVNTALPAISVTS